MSPMREFSFHLSRRLLCALSLATLLVTNAACHQNRPDTTSVVKGADESTVSTDSAKHKNSDSRARPFYPVVVDPKPYVKLTPEERKRLEDDAIQRIVDLQPPEARQLVATELRGELATVSKDGLTYRQLAGSSDPETARLLSVLASVRAADAAADPQASASM